MKLYYEEIKTLPPLSWYAYVKDGIANVVHGSQVETTKTFFVEGAWDGNFLEGDFSNAEWFCGTGAKVDGDKIEFSTPTHLTAGIYQKIDREGGYWFSNSLHLLLVKAELKLDPNYKEYEIDFNTVLKGIYQYQKEVHTLNEGETKSDSFPVSIIYFRNFSVDDTNNASEIVKPCVDPFLSYANYFNRITAAMQRLTKNASDLSRKHRYGSVANISRGYDSPASAVIAKKAGCDCALTFKAEGKHVDDSGVDIARKLGYTQIIERDAKDYQNGEECIEAAYLCTGELGATISSGSFDQDYARNLVFTGTHGDFLWSMDCQYRNNECHFKARLSQLGSCERRLWVGYIPVPTPAYGATAWESLYLIANSDEMAAWRLNNDYDRPIARRILEDEGIPREWFGMEKHGAGFYYHYDWMRRLIPRLSESSQKSFLEFVHRNQKRNIKKLGEVSLWFSKTWKVYWNAIFKNKFQFKLDKEKLSQVSNPMGVRYLIPWASEVICEKYKVALAKRIE